MKKKPDINNGTGCYGGYLKDIKKPHIRKFSLEGSKRKVKCIITRYGFFPHYWAAIQVEKNSIWDFKRGYWVECWDDKSFGRDSLYYDFYPDMSEKECNSFKEASDWIDKMIKKKFSGKEWEIMKEYDKLVDGMKEGD
jgi:hypothetical protein